MKLILISNRNEIVDASNGCIFVTFSKTLYEKFRNKINVYYFFDIDSNVDEKIILKNVEKSLHKESEDPDKKYFILTTWFIRKYFITYKQFINRFMYILNINKIERILLSKNVSFILKRAILALCKNKNIEISYNNEYCDDFSYRHSEFMTSDLPKKLDNTNLFIYVYAFFLKLKSHKTFIFPMSIDGTLTKKITYFRASVFSIKNWLKEKVFNYKNNEVPYGFQALDFSKSNGNIIDINRSHWQTFTSSEKDLIQDIISTFFNTFDNTYLSNLERKIKNLLIGSKTKRVILDETNDAFRRLTCIVCKENKISVDFLPHGLIHEDIQFPYTDNQFINKYIPKIISWSTESSNYLISRKLMSYPINFPLKISSPIKQSKKDILIMLCNGDRLELNSFEELIINLMPLHQNLRLTIDYKTHHHGYERFKNACQKQLDHIEDEFSHTISIIPSEIPASSIMKNYELIIFTEWTTGIYEAAILDIPFVLFIKDKNICHSFDKIDIPIMKNIKELQEYILNNNYSSSYLADIRNSLNSNMPFEKYYA